MTGTGGIGFFSVEFTVTSEKAVKLGLKLQNTTATWVNFDNFTLEKTSTTGIGNVNLNDNVNDNYWYTLDGRRLTGKPTAKGLYIKDGRKVVLR